jgi:hypothetical protein
MLRFLRDFCGLAQTSGSKQMLTRQPTRVIGRKEHRNRSDIIGLAATTQWGSCDQILDEIAADKAAGMRPLGFYESGVDRVDANFLWTKLFSQGHR